MTCRQITIAEAENVYEEVISRETAIRGREYRRNLYVENSALKKRILDGRLPLQSPPPLRHGAPWYAIVEGDKPEKVAINLKSQSEGVIWIEDDQWIILSSDENSIVVTHHHWQCHGLTWNLQRKDTPASAAPTAIMAHYTASIARITTLEQLKAEAQYQAMIWANGLLKASALIGEGGHKRLSLQASPIAQRYAAEVRHRIARGAPAEPDAKETADKAHQVMMNLMGSTYSVSECGDLIITTWTLRRATPAHLRPSHYLAHASTKG